jgi:hypothetical protein
VAPVDCWWNGESPVAVEGTAVGRASGKGHMKTAVAVDNYCFNLTAVVLKNQAWVKLSCMAWC